MTTTENLIKALTEAMPIIKWMQGVVNTVNYKLDDLYKAFAALEQSKSEKPTCKKCDTVMLWNGLLNHWFCPNCHEKLPAPKDEQKPDHPHPDKPERGEEEKTEQHQARTLKEVKDEIAKKYGYDSWDSRVNGMMTHITNETILGYRMDEVVMLYSSRQSAPLLSRIRELETELAKRNEPDDCSHERTDMKSLRCTICLDCGKIMDVID